MPNIFSNLRWGDAQNFRRFFDVSFTDVKDVQHQRQQRRPNPIGLVDADNAVSNVLFPRRPARRLDLFQRFCGAVFQRQIKPQTFNRLESVLFLRSPFRRFRPNARRLVPQRDAGFDFVPMLTARTAAPTAVRFALSIQFFVRKVGVVHSRE